MRFCLLVVCLTLLGNFVDGSFHKIKFSQLFFFEVIHHSQLSKVQAGHSGKHVYNLGYGQERAVSGEAAKKQKSFPFIQITVTYP